MIPGWLNGNQTFCFTAYKFAGKAARKASLRRGAAIFTFGNFDFEVVIFKILFQKSQILIMSIMATIYNFI